MPVHLCGLRRDPGPDPSPDPGPDPGPDTGPISGPDLRVLLPCPRRLRFKSLLRRAWIEHAMLPVRLLPPEPITEHHRRLPARPVPGPISVADLASNHRANRGAIPSTDCAAFLVPDRGTDPGTNTGANGGAGDPDPDIPGRNW